MDEEIKAIYRLLLGNKPGTIDRVEEQTEDTIKIHRESLWPIRYIHNFYIYLYTGIAYTP